MDNLKIESVTFLKMINHSTQIFEKTITPNSVMKISLPRVKFLEKDGEYRPSWAVEKEAKPPVNLEEIPLVQKKAIKKDYMRRYKFDTGQYEISELEQEVYNLHSQGLNKEQICKRMNKKGSAVTAALRRFEAKTLARANKK